MSWSLIQRSPTRCVYLMLCDPEMSTMRQPRPKVDGLLHHILKNSVQNVTTMSAYNEMEK
jgi:hypothetical protein